MRAKEAVKFVLAAVLVCFAACPASQEDVVVVKSYPADSLDGVITKSGVQVDEKVSSDGKGALRITTEEPTVIQLFETGDLDVEKARLIYKARIRTEDVEGNVYLEMYCQFSGKGDFFSRDLQSPLTGTNDWTTEETPFFLQKGENPDNVKLNLVFTGKGTAWVDDIKLLKAPLK